MTIDEILDQANDILRARGCTCERTGFHQLAPTPSGEPVGVLEHRLDCPAKGTILRMPDPE